MRAQLEKMLRKNLAVWFLLFFVPAVGFAASDDFYQRLFKRGIARFSSGDYASALSDLRMAAFGSIEQIETFETAEFYASLAAHRLEREDDAREAFLRIISAETNQPHFRSIKLPEELRAEADTTAAALLTREEATLLGVPAPIQDAAAAAKRRITVPTPTKAPNVAVTVQRRSDDPGAKPPPAQAAPDTPPKQTVPPAGQPAAASAPEHGKGTVEARLAAAQGAIDEGDLPRALLIYQTLLSVPKLSHDAALRLAEGLYRLRDFAGAASAFQRVALAHGEERYHYDYAVALFESGQAGPAKRELAASLPFITMTPDVDRYRAKIEAATERPK
jgi:tetratricopeptide (TPR) repeat protein